MITRLLTVNIAATLYTNISLFNVFKGNLYIKISYTYKYFVEFKKAYFGLFFQY